MKRPALVILLGGLTVAIAMGARQSFGLFLQPITATLSTGRETFSLAMARAEHHVRAAAGRHDRRPDRSSVGGRRRRRPVRGGVRAAVAGGLDGHALPGARGDGRPGAERDLVRGDSGGRGTVGPGEEARNGLRHHHRRRIVRDLRHGAGHAVADRRRPVAGDAAVCRACGRSSRAVRDRLPGPLAGLGAVRTRRPRIRTR